MKTIKNVLHWVWYSSSNPNRVSLTIKSMGIALIPYVIQLAGVACGFNLVCVAVDGSALTTVVETVANIVYWTLSIVAGVGFLYGFFRKLAITLTR